MKVPAIVRGSRVPAKAAGKVPAEGGTQQYGASGSNAWEAGEGRLAKTKKYERGGRKQGHDFSYADRTDRTTQERVQYQRAGPPGQLLHR